LNHGLALARQALCHLSHTPAHHELLHLL
jgi:hypothetical protein